MRDRAGENKYGQECQRYYEHIKKSIVSLADTISNLKSKQNQLFDHHVMAALRHNFLPMGNGDRNDPHNYHRGCNAMLWAVERFCM